MEGIDNGEVVVDDPTSVRNKIAAIRAAGPSKLQVCFCVLSA